MTFRVLDLFSGIGGFSLGLERTGGFQTVAFCEIEPYCRAVLAKHWPDVPCYDDVRTLTADALARDGIAVDVICGGFPCQDISFAGKGAGLAGERSGLWRQYARIVGELRPRYVIVENVSALLGRGLGDVLGDLAALGYDAVWHCVPASAVGAPHRRDRLWLVAYPGGKQHESRGAKISRALAAELYASNADSQGEHVGPVDAEMASASQHASNAASVQRLAIVGSEPHRDHAGAQNVAGAGSQGLSEPQCEVIRGTRWRYERRATEQCGWWTIEPDVGRVAHGVSSRVDRLRGIGNAVVPEIPYRWGRAILKAEGRIAA